MKLPRWAVMRYLSQQGKLHDPAYLAAAEAALEADLSLLDIVATVLCHPVVTCRAFWRGLRSRA